MLFQQLYDSLPMGVVICALPSYEVVYTNAYAHTMLPLPNYIDYHHFDEIFAFTDDGEADWIKSVISSGDSIQDYTALLRNQMRILLNGNQILHEHKTYLALYVQHVDRLSESSPQSNKDVLYQIYTALYSADTADDKLNHILAHIGNHIHCNRAYVLYMDTYGHTAADTYEWCAPGVSGQIHNMQCLLAEFPCEYDPAYTPGNVLVYDRQTASPAQRDALVSRDIQSVLLLPFFVEDKLIGFMGFDQCDGSRDWTGEEICLIQNVGTLSLSLLQKKSADASLLRRHEMTKAVLNNMSSNIHVTDIDTHEILFVNHSFQRQLGYHKSSELEGKICWQVFESGQKGPCAFCPAKKLLEKHGRTTGITLKGEIKNNRLDKWFTLEDCFIEWIDGRIVHMANGIEYHESRFEEEHVEYYASIDTLTNVYNKEWGMRLFQVERERAKRKNHSLTLCFFDIGGLRAIQNQCEQERSDDLVWLLVNLVKNTVRETDILFRWGNKEFVLLLTRCKVESAQKIIQKIRHQMENMQSSGALPGALSLNAGIQEVSTSNAMTDEEIIAIADKKMYIEKFNRKKVTRRHEAT